METAAERFKKRQEIKKSLDIGFRDTIAESAVVVNRDYTSANDNIFSSFDFSVDQAEVLQLLSDIKSNYDKQKFEELLTSCKENIVNAIVTPLGLGRIVASWDKNGGNVTTIHNAREGVYSSAQELAAYERRGDYNSAEYHSHPAYIQKNRQLSELKQAGKLQDEYTGKIFAPNADVDLDHTKAAKEIHDDPGRVLSGLDGSDLANADSNLNATAKSQNRAMGAKTIDEYHAWLQQTAAARQQRIQELSDRTVLSDKEKSELSKLKEQQSFDYSLAHEKDQKARKEYENKVNTTYYTSGKFISKVASSSAIEGTKMGMQQALGVAFCEFFYGILDEAKDIYRNGFRCNDASFFESLKTRFMRIAHRVQEKWRDVLDAFKQGFISGLFSNLVTIIINMFVRTGKNIIRIIREGIFSLFKAVKMLLMPPAGMTVRQAAHEATKIIAAGLTIAGGILLEEYVDKLIKLAPMLEFISDILTTVVIGTVTGLASAFIVYSLDKMDIFDVNAQAEYEHTINLLTESMDSSLENAEKICNSIVF